MWGGNGNEIRIEKQKGILVRTLFARLCVYEGPMVSLWFMEKVDWEEVTAIKTESKF